MQKIENANSRQIINLKSTSFGLETKYFKFHHLHTLRAHLGLKVKSLRGLEYNSIRT